jgi:hypothetical protein
VGTSLLNWYLVTIGGEHRDIQTEGKDLWSSSLRWAEMPGYTYIHTKFHKERLRHLNVNGREFADTDIKNIP